MGQCVSKLASMHCIFTWALARAAATLAWELPAGMHSRLPDSHALVLPGSPLLQ